MTLAPEIYKITPVYTQTIDATVEGYHATFDWVTDQTLLDRERDAYEEIGLTEFTDYLGRTEMEAIVEGMFRGIYRAWRDNDPWHSESRKDVSFEWFMRLASIGDESLLLIADDLRSPDAYEPTVMSVDVAHFRRIVFVDKDSSSALLFKDMDLTADILNRALAVHVWADGDWEVWVSLPYNTRPHPVTRMAWVMQANVMAADYLSAPVSMHGHVDLENYDELIYRAFSVMYKYRVEP